MGYTKIDRVVLKLGGHLLFNDNGSFNIGYLKDLAKTLKILEEKIDKLVIVVGGGHKAREYINTAREFISNNSALDRLGIAVSHINALLLSLILGKLPYTIPSSLQELMDKIYERKIIIIGGFQPGQSTTTVSALVAEAINADMLIIATDVDGIYTSDPKKNPDAKLVKEITITELEKIFEESVIDAGEYKLLDTYTIKILKRSHIPTVVLNGKNPENLIKILHGYKIGTLIKT